MNTRTEGAIGEEIAVLYLQKQKYKIIERNYSISNGEIDIIAKDGKYYVFIEVKRRKTDKFGMPREAVTVKKQQTIAYCATKWLTQNHLYGSPVRFDVVEIIDDKINLIKDAFRC